LVKRIFAAILIFIFVIGTASCNRNKKARYEAEFLTLFDTVTQIIAYTQSKEEFTKYSQLIYDKLEEYHRLYDIYKDYEGINNIKTINDNAGISPVKVDKKIIDLLVFSKNQYKNTSGKMNIAFGSVLKIWHDYRTRGIDDFENAQVPPIDMMKVASEHTDIDKIIIDEEKSTVFLDDPYMSLDVGAVGKGYASEQVSLFAIENGFTSGLISVGGNVRTIGNKGDNGKLWNVGIQSPDKESENSTVQTVYISDLSVVTSGSYQRYYTVGDKKYHHIIDPVTLFPSQYFTAVTIVCKDSGLADVLSTAVFNMSYEEGLKLINSIQGAEALWILNSGEIKYSAGFEKLTKKQ